MMVGLFHKAYLMSKVFGLSTTKFRSYKDSTTSQQKDRNPNGMQHGNRGMCLRNTLYSPEEQKQRRASDMKSRKNKVI